MLLMLFMLQSNQCPLVDSGIAFVKETIPAQNPNQNEMAITQNYHVSRYYS